MRAGVLVAESFLTGIFEALLLVLVVTAALSIAGEADAIQLTIPLLGERELAPWPSLIVAAVFGLAVLLIHLHIGLLTARLSAAVLRTARARAIAGFAGASWERQAQEREGSLQETVSSLVAHSSNLAVALSHFASAAVVLATLLVAAFVVNPLATLIVLFFGALLFGGLRPIGAITRTRARDYVQHNSSFTEAVSEWSSLAMELRVFGVEGAEVERLSQKNKRAADAAVRSRFAARAGSWLLRDLGVLFLVAAAGALYLVGDVDLPSVGAVVLLIVRSLSYAQNANTALQQVNEQSPNLEALVERIESLERSVGYVGSAPLDTISTIEMVDVGYDYEPGRPGISRVTLRILPGEAIGVIGPSGGGKTTLAQVLLRLRLPTRGSVLVSGIPYEEIAPASWHRLVALVPQEPRLFQGTVAENIAFLRPGVTERQVEQAAAAAHVLEDLQRLPQGLATSLGPRGAGLSGGQKQRVAIARALVGRPELLVLDEPTSALDIRSEQLLQETIRDLEGRITLVIIAHRLGTLAACTRVAAMEGGQVKLVGSLEEALACVEFERLDPPDSQSG